ncbi:MAG: M15 family metallopeptidase [Myxococcales bacterium]|nr:M15 family metallopeptidase [Myxococcales bacterium]
MMRTSHWPSPATPARRSSVALIALALAGCVTLPPPRDAAPDRVEPRLVETTTPIAPIRPPPPAPPPVDPARIPGGHHLAKLHPEVRRMALALYSEAAAAGVELRFISGYRAFKPTSAKARAGRASWHEFGMAFDLILAHRRDMKTALRHYDDDEDAWDTVGAIGERLGLKWGLEWGRHEVFHFEWHPGMKSAIRRADLERLLADAGADGKAYPKTWWRFPGGEAPAAVAVTTPAAEAAAPATSAAPPIPPAAPPADPQRPSPPPAPRAPRRGGIEAAPSGI